MKKIKHLFCKVSARLQIKLLSVVLLALLTQTAAQSQTPPNHVWAKQLGLGGTYFNEPRSIISDASGAVYVTGTFSQTNDFDPGPGVYNLTAVAGSDIFILKLDGNGNFVWARHISGGGDDIASSSTLDHAGNVFITGYFYGTVDFDPGPGEVLLTANPGLLSDAFILKLDTAGIFSWVKQIGGDATVGAHSIDLDESDNILVGGKFAGTADFNPGPLQNNLTAISVSTDNFILKLNHSGEFVWVKQVGGPTGATGPSSFAADKDNNVVIAGSFAGGDCDFDPGAGVSNLNSSGNYTGFVLMLDSNGIFKWVKPFAGAMSNMHIRSLNLPGSEIYFTGDFYGSIDFDPGPSNYPMTAAGEMGIAVKLDQDGNFIWANSLPFLSACSSVGPNGSLYAGCSTGSTRSLTKLDGNGNEQWSFSWDNIATTKFSALYVDALTNIYAAGFFAGTNDFDPGAGTDQLTSVASADIFVHKLNELSVVSLGFLSFTAINHNSGNLLTWQIQDNLYAKGRFQIQKSMDGLNFISEHALDLTGNTNRFSFLDAPIDTGTNYYRIRYDDVSGSSIYSGVVAVTKNSTSSEALKVWPLPANDFVNVQSAISYNNASINVFDMNGKLVFSQHHCNGNYFRIRLGQLVKGTYCMVVTDSKNRQQVMVVK